MLYTTYTYNLGSLPSDAIKLVITRFPPKWLDISKFQNTYLSKSLSPTQELLLNYKENKDWNAYQKGFLEEMKTRPDLIEGLSRLRRLLSKGKDVYILCVEKDYLHCHRYLIALVLEQEGFEWREWKII